MQLIKSLLFLLEVMDNYLHKFCSDQLIIVFVTFQAPVANSEVLAHSLVDKPDYAAKNIHNVI